MRQIFYRRTHILALIGLMVATSITTVQAASSSNQKTQEGGTTLKHQERGVKKAVQNIEQEIPKMGAAIGAGFNKLTGSGERSTPAKSGKEEKKH